MFFSYPMVVVLSFLSYRENWSNVFGTFSGFRPNILNILRFVIACTVPIFVSIYTVTFDRNFSEGIAAIAAGGKR
jgi:hypothetical protein